MPLWLVLPFCVIVGVRSFTGSFNFFFGVEVWFDCPNVTLNSSTFGPFKTLLLLKLNLMFASHTFFGHTVSTSVMGDDWEQEQIKIWGEINLELVVIYW